MNTKYLVGLCGALVISVSSLSAADIIGKVTFKGTQPKERALPLDPQCGKTHQGKPKPTTTFYVVGPNKELADVFVTLDGIKGKSTGASAEPALLDQVGCVYTPYVLAIQTGQTLNVKNSDPFLHNVHPTPKPGTQNKEANKAQLGNGPILKFSFPSAEEFLRFKCDVHPWMFAYVNVVDHPYYDVTKKTGTFTIKNVPAGTYKIKAKHRKVGEVIQDVTVGNDNVTVDFVLELK